MRGGLDGGTTMASDISTDQPRQRAGKIVAWCFIGLLALVFLAGVSGLGASGGSSPSYGPCDTPNPTQADVYACARAKVEQNPYENRW